MPFRLDHVAPLGVTRSAIDFAIASGRIARLAQGVYIAADALAEDAAGRHLQRAAAHQMLRPNLIGSHATAALAWGLDLPDPAESAAGPVEFIAPPGPRVRSIVREELRVAVRRLPPEHRVAHPCGLNVTTAARAAVDVASRLDLPRALIALDCAARLELEQSVGRSRLRAAYAKQASIAAACRPLNEAVGVAATRLDRERLARLVALADPRRESALESYSYGQMILAGIPLPELQVRIITPVGDRYPDFLWPREMVIGEADGDIKYRDAGAHPAEKHRQEQLEQIGYRFVRWNPQQIYAKPSDVMRRILLALEARRGL